MYIFCLQAINLNFVHSRSSKNDWWCNVQTILCGLIWFLSLFDWIEIQTNSSKKYFKTWIEINCITKRCEKQNWNSSPTTRIHCTGCLKLKWQIKAFVSFYLQRLLMQQLERKRVKMLKNLWNISHVRWHSHYTVPRSFCSSRGELHYWKLIDADVRKIFLLNNFFLISDGAQVDVRFLWINVEALSTTKTTP